MESLGKYKNFIIVIGVGMLLAGAFLVLSQGGGAGAAVALSEETEQQLAMSEQIEREIIQELRKIQSISIDNSLYENAAFTSLIDFSNPIAPQEVGRDNPFAPIGQ